MMKTMTIPMALAIVAAMCGGVHGSDLDAALSKLESWEAEDTAAPLYGLMETIRSKASVGDKEVWERLQPGRTGRGMRPADTAL